MRAIYVAARDPEYARRIGRRPLRDVMSTPVLAVQSTATLGEALSVMVGATVRHLAVVDEDGRCLGVLADRAVAAAWAIDHTALESQTVASALEARPAMIGVGSAVVDAARMMHRMGVDAVLATAEDGKPVGIVTGTDLISLLAS